jgi:hypothetical protein
MKIVFMLLCVALASCSKPRDQYDNVIDAMAANRTSPPAKTRISPAEVRAQTSEDIYRSTVDGRITTLEHRIAELERKQSDRELNVGR